MVKVRQGVLELLLLNHPLDCPICDKAGECWLQNYSMRYGSREARTIEPRRKRGKRLDIGERMLLDQERCILCRRCVRFCREVSKTGELLIFGHGDRDILDIYDRRLDNDYSMCTADICPVGALETKDFHHRLRVWFLTETGSVCPGCANGCNIMICHYKDRIYRLLPRRNDEVNQTWMCDWGRFEYKVVGKPERLRTPLIAVDGTQKPAPWREAIAAASEALRRVLEQRSGAAIGAIISPHLTNEENFRFGELLGHLGVKLRAMAVRRGKADDFLLIKAEKAANARGVRELGLVTGAHDGLEALLSAAEKGELAALYLCGQDVCDIVESSRLTNVLNRTTLLIAHVLENRPELAKASVLFPMTTWAEKQGTFVNHAGRVQRINQAIETPAEWMSDGEVFTAILGRLSGHRESFEPQAVFDKLARQTPRFASLTYARVGMLGELLGAGQGQGDEAVAR